MVYTRHYRDAVLKTLVRVHGFVPIDLGEGNSKSIDALKCVRPDVLLVDLSNQRLSAFVPLARAAVPSTPIIALNRGETESEVLSLFECGLSGFVVHDASEDGLLDGVRAALRGEFECPPRIAAALVRRVNAVAEGRANHQEPGTPFTPRETQVARLLRECRSNKEIASELSIDHGTVKNHVHRILGKLGLQHRWQLLSPQHKGLTLPIDEIDGKLREP